MLAHMSDPHVAQGRNTATRRRTANNITTIHTTATLAQTTATTLHSDFSNHLLLFISSFEQWISQHNTTHITSTITVTPHKIGFLRILFLYISFKPWWRWTLSIIGEFSTFYLLASKNFDDDNKSSSRYCLFYLFFHWPASLPDGD